MKNKFAIAGFALDRLVAKTALLTLTGLISTSCATWKSPKAPTPKAKSNAEIYAAVDLGTTPAQQPCTKTKTLSLVIHGGVGYLANQEQSDTIRRLLTEGQTKLAKGDRAIDVVQSIDEGFENSGIFNSGRGGTRTSAGTVELDASIMDGKDMTAGAVASLKDVKNPIRLARFVKDHTPHLLMVGAGASALADQAGYEKVQPTYFTSALEKSQNYQHGTVGAVAIDRCGDIAAATSTGGLFGKIPGRVGDSPIIGAGTYANNETVGVSATGDGEKFIRASVAARISFLLQYQKRSLKSAARESLELVQKFKGGGGLIAIAKDHTIITDTTDKSPMPSGWVHEDGKIQTRDLK